MKLELIGYNKLREQDLYILEADSFDNFPRIIQLSSKYFITLVVCDCVNSNIVDISNLMKILLDNGARYFIGWGPNSTLIDDLADWEVIADGRFEDKDKLIMTAWIDDESIKKAIFFAFNCAFPKEIFNSECKSVLAVCIDDPDSASKIRKAFIDPEKFVGEYVED